MHKFSLMIVAKLLTVLSLYLSCASVTKAQTTTEKSKAPAPATAPKSVDKAAEKPAIEKPASNGTSTVPTTPIESEIESGAWGFVMTHHPELGEVLSRLKTMHPKQYEKAIQQIAVSAERINRFMKTDKVLGEMELNDWKYESQVKLLAAKISLMGPEQAIVEEELAKTVRKQLENRIKINELQRERAALRLKMLDEQTAKLSKNLDEDVERRVKNLRDEINRTRSTLKQNNTKQPGPNKTKSAE
jgi:hypothetical protein